MCKSRRFLTVPRSRQCHAKAIIRKPAQHPPKTTRPVHHSLSKARIYPYSKRFARNVTLLQQLNIATVTDASWRAGIARRAQL